MDNLIKNQTLLNELKEARANRKPWLGNNAISDINHYFSVKEFESLINQTGSWNSEKLQLGPEAPLLIRADGSIDLERLNKLLQEKDNSPTWLPE